MTIKQQLISELENVLKKLEVSDVAISVDYPSDPKHGDYATNVALVAGKKAGKNPREVAEEIIAQLQRAENIEQKVEKIEIAGAGFINFWVKEQGFLNVIASGREAIPDVGKGKKVIVEYSSPNIAKPFTIGHLRSTIIGDAVANLLEATGWDVKRDNHLGDWGTQFGKQIAALKYIDLEKTEEVDVSGDGRFTEKNIKAIEESNRPVKLLVDLYVKFHEAAEKNPALEGIARAEFAELENEKETEEDRPDSRRDLWKKCIEWSWKEFDKIYQELGVSFTENGGRGYGESFFEDKMMFVLHELKNKDFYREGKEGAKIVEFPEEIKLPPLMILKKDKATLYSTRDLATDKFRLEQYGKDLIIINEVGSEQALYFKQLYKLEEMLGWFKEGQRIHKMHGLYRFKEGKMSTRKGNVIWLEDVLEEALNRAHELAMEKGIEAIDEHTSTLNKRHIVGGDSVRDEITREVAIGALKWNDLRRSSEQDIVFDWDEILNMQGNSGPYIQYTYARTRSVLRKFETQSTKSETNTKYEILNTKYQFEVEERELLKLLSRFPEIVGEAAERLAPNLLCTYLFELAQAFNLFYQKCQILKPEGTKETKGTASNAAAAEETNVIRDFRLSITRATGETLKKGLSLLGIYAPEKM
jgi:arginyl-tRNA synthetase